MSAVTKFAVLGAGSWGTALAMTLARNGIPTVLWDINQDLITQLSHTRENHQYLPGITFPDNLSATAELDLAIESSTDILIAVPSHAFSSLLEGLLPTEKKIIWATKGLSREGELLSNIMKPRYAKPFGILSGPSFAKEVAEAVPTAVTIASEDKNLAAHFKQQFENPNFKIELSDDIIGVQLGGVVKNVVALATGISDGLGYGANTRAALITQGLSEMQQLGQALGAKPETFLGLSGLGDLVLTCTDNQSRNRRFGLALGEGQDRDKAYQTIGQVVEGEGNASQLCDLARRHHLALSLVSTVQGILQGTVEARDLVGVI